MPVKRRIHYQQQAAFYRNKEHRASAKLNTKGSFEWIWDSLGAWLNMTHIMTNRNTSQHGEHASGAGHSTCTNSLGFSLTFFLGLLLNLVLITGELRLRRVERFLPGLPSRLALEAGPLSRVRALRHWRIQLARVTAASIQGVFSLSVPNTFPFTMNKFNTKSKPHQT